MTIEENLAKNLIKYRKAYDLTQIQIAEMLNYSDKAVSKWERAESIPDVTVLKKIADFYGTTIDLLISEPNDKPIKRNHNLTKKRAIIALLSVALVWLVATCFFAFINIIFPNLQKTWLAFIYAIPVSCIVLLVFTSVWGKNFANALIVSLLVWTIGLTVNLSSDLPNIWLIFIIGVPLQVLTILWFLYKKIA